MTLLLWLLALFAALQFTSAIGQWISVNKDATQASALLQSLASKLGFAGAIITTRMFIIAVFAAVYLLLPKDFLWLLMAGIAYYLYSTGKWVSVWSKLKAKAESAVSSETAQVVKTVEQNVQQTVASDVQTAIDDVKKTL